ncbi:MAG: hypothetical protein ACLT98_13020 [Eggerthellaceae bacterium]
MRAISDSAYITYDARSSSPSSLHGATCGRTKRRALHRRPFVRSFSDARSAHAPDMFPMSGPADPASQRLHHWGDHNHLANMARVAVPADRRPVPSLLT